MNGLSSTALQNTTSFAQPIPSRSAVSFAVSTMISPMRATASMLMPARVVPTLTDAQTRSVRASASGSDFDQRAVAGRHALVHERGETAQEIDADFCRPRGRALGEHHVVVALGRFRDERDRRHRDTLVDDRHAVLVLDLIAHRDQPPGRRQILS